MTAVKTPCLGICSTTSVGDVICRGCKRYAHEVINWNGYDEVEKLAVLQRIERLTSQIIETRLQIVSETELQQGLKALKIPFDRSLSPYCWLHNLLKRGHNRLRDLQSFGVIVRADYRHLPLTVLCELVDREIITLCEAHYIRYIEPPRREPEMAE